MINGIFAASVIAFASLIDMSGAGAGSPAPDLRPQWLQSYTADIYAQDRIDSEDGPAWVRLSNSDVVVFTVLQIPGPNGDALLARRFANDGALLQTRVLPSSATGVADYSRIIARADPVSGNVVVMIGSRYNTNAVAPCRLLRFDAVFDLKSSTLLGETTPYSKACVSMHVLVDGSAVAADDYGLSRVDVQGNIIWTVRNGDDSRYLSPSDMLVDNAGAVWVSSRGAHIGTSNGSNMAAVLRFGLDGQRLSEDYFLCAACIANVSNTLDLLDNGEVTVGGGAGSLQPGFFARYAANGTRVLETDTEPDTAYIDLAHDADGAIYALATGPSGTQARRLDPATGAVLWVQPADDFTAATHGIVVIRNATAYGIDAAGTTLWNRALSSTGNVFVTHPERVGSRVEVLVKSYTATPDCGRAPKLVSLDASGNLDVVAQSCSMPTSTFVGSLDALARNGILMNTRKLLSAYTQDGDLLWQTPICLYCSELYWLTAALTPSGSAWAIRYDANSGLSGIDRFDTSGQPSASLPIDLLNHPQSSIRLLASENQAVVMSMFFQTMVWQRARLNSPGVDTQMLDLPRQSHFNAVRKLSDGAITMVLAADGCGFICPPIPPFFAVARLASDGSLAWMYQVPEGYGVAALGDHGGANIVVPGTTVTLRKIDADGHAQPDIALPAIDNSEQALQGLYGPRQGRLLLVTSSFSHVVILWSIDASGAVLARRELGDYGTDIGIDDAQPGFLITRDPFISSGSVLIDPVSLRTLASFRFDDTPVDLDYANTKFWRVLAGGAVFGTDLQTDTSGLIQARVARFSVPGTAASNLIFRDSFD